GKADRACALPCFQQGVLSIAKAFHIPDQGFPHDLPLSAPRFHLKMGQMRITMAFIGRRTETQCWLLPCPRLRRIPEEKACCTNGVVVVLSGRRSEPGDRTNGGEVE